MELEGVPLDASDRAAGASWRTIITHEGWKLNAATEDRCELYDLNSDPLERDNLIDRPDWRARAQELMARIRQWQKQTGDDMPLPAR